MLRRYITDYRAEIGLSHKSDTPWQDLELFCQPHPIPLLAHVVQSRAKIGALNLVDSIKKHSYVIVLRRRDKISQFASWIYFRSIKYKYNFDHRGQDYVAPDTYQVTYDDLLYFATNLIVDDYYDPNLVLYYEDIDFATSSIRKNQYSFDPTLMIRNIDMVKKFFADWPQKK